MNNTALRAKTQLRSVAQSANNTHGSCKRGTWEILLWKIGTGEDNLTVGQADCYHKALIYILGISDDTRNHFRQIYDIKSGLANNEQLGNRACGGNGWQACAESIVKGKAGSVQSTGGWRWQARDWKREREGGNAITIQQSIKMQTHLARFLENYDWFSGNFRV